ncbi:MAG: VCBS repeat-containing protein [Planctomycetales bacterium]|nr:VCBS repeat-containing protein [Planctomycetales bacterium]
MTQIPLTQQSPVSFVPADVDGDGDMDLLAPNSRVYWYENDDGELTTPQPLTNIAGSNIQAADVDADGDVDVIAESALGIVWFENVVPGDRLETKLLLANPAATLVQVVDIDADGAKDLLLKIPNNQNLVWMKNAGGFFPEILRPTPLSAEAKWWADLDGDGDQDAVIGGRSQLYWQENLGGQFSSKRHLLLDSINDERPGIDIGDLDGDGDLDVAIVHGEFGHVSVVRNDGSGNFSAQTVHQSSDRTYAKHLSIADVNGDGQNDILFTRNGWLDVLMANDNGSYQHSDLLRFSDSPNFTWFRSVTGVHLSDDAVPSIVFSIEYEQWGLPLWATGNGIGHVRSDGTFVGFGLPGSSAALKTAFDADQDGNIDVGSGYRFLATEPQVGFTGDVIAFSEGGDLPERPWFADIDGDGKDDVIWHDWKTDRLSWANWSTSGLVDSAEILTSDYVSSVVSADLDQDGRDELAVWHSGQVDLLRLNEAQTWETERTFDVTDWNSGHPKFVDWDSDGDLDLALIDERQLKIYANNEGHLATEARIFSGDARYFSYFYDFVDMDYDGDLDLLATQESDRGSAYLVWLERLDQEYGTTHEIGPLYSGIHGGSDYQFQAIDLHLDGDMDVVAFSYVPNPDVWETYGTIFENQDGQFVRHDDILGHTFGTRNSPIFGDFDQDGDVDLVFNQFWYRNDSATGAPGDINLDGTIDQHDVDLLFAAMRIAADPKFDLNADGMVNSDDAKFLLFEILDTPVGDVNLDGFFDSADLVLIFQANQYDDGIQGNSTWRTGDWNGDYDFDSADLVFAFQHGNFVANSISPVRPLVMHQTISLANAVERVRTARQMTPAKWNLFVP